MTFPRENRFPRDLTLNLELDTTSRLHRGRNFGRYKINFRLTFHPSLTSASGLKNPVSDSKLVSREEISSRKIETRHVQVFCRREKNISFDNKFSNVISWIINKKKWVEGEEKSAWMRSVNGRTRSSISYKAYLHFRESFNAATKYGFR